MSKIIKPNFTLNVNNKVLEIHILQLKKNRPRQYNSALTKINNIGCGWFIPSKAELSEIFKVYKENKEKIYVNLSDKAYWTSTPHRNKKTVNWIIFLDKNYSINYLYQSTFRLNHVIYIRYKN